MPFGYATLSDGTRLWYREAGNRSNPSIVLLHGFPTSSNMFRHLIPLLSSKYHLVAPDLPGFGVSEPAKDYKFTFASFADNVDELVKQLGLKKFAIYIMDYGAPTGLRLALKDTSRITAIISQSGNAYDEGLGEFWEPIQKYWKSEITDQSLRKPIGESLLTLETTKWQYEYGSPKDIVLEPHAWLLDWALLQRPGNFDIQLDLFYDYQHNVTLYPDFQKWFRESNVPILAVWGKNDHIFIHPGAEAYKKDSKNVTVKYLDAGHFALETHVDVYAKEIDEFLSALKL